MSKYSEEQAGATRGFGMTDNYQGQVIAHANKYYRKMQRLIGPKEAANQALANYLNHKIIKAKKHII